MPTSPLAERVEDLRLVDHHAHGALRRGVDRTGFEQLITESDRPVPSWMTSFDSQLGFAIRRHCAPLIGLEPHVSADDYWAARSALDEDKIAEVFLPAAGVEHFLLDTGYRGDEIHGVDEMAALSGSAVHEIVRLESVLEDAAATSTDTAGFINAFDDLLASRRLRAVGLKSVIAYRHGLDFDPAPPGDQDVRAAAARWLARRNFDGALPPVDDPVLLRWALWAGVRTGLPIQLHVGFGDPDIDLHRCDPLLLTPWLREIEPLDTIVTLLHCYPYHRQAGYLAHVFPHVYLDVGLALNYAGVRSAAILAESLEVAPFGRMLFSSDAWGPAELHFLGAELWRRAYASVVGAWVDSGDWAAGDAARVATMIGRDNALRLYGISP